MTDFLTQKREEIDGRLNELRPLVDEYRRLEAAVAALDGMASDGSSSTASPPASAGRARKPARRSSAGTGRRGRPKGSGTRAGEALSLVKANPGITIPEIAEKMGIKQNYLYRVLPALAEDGLVDKQGRGWHATAAA
jgi:hypothetical protein